MSTEQEWRVYATAESHQAFIHSFIKLQEAERLRTQINWRYGKLDIQAHITDKIWETNIAWTELKNLAARAPEKISPQRNCSVEVWGKNTKWLRRLHRAGLTYDESAQCWSRGGMTWEQAKSLTGRMREAGLKVLLHGRSPVINKLIAAKHDSEYAPTPYDELREDAARRKISQSLAKKGRRARHPKKDKARKSYETEKSGLDKSDRTP